MKKYFLLSSVFALVMMSCLFVSCKKSTTPVNNSGNGGSNCTNVNIAITETVVNHTPCQSGSIAVTATGSTGYTYNSNSGTYQSSNIFTGLTAGTYTIGVKDANGCTNTKSIVVSETPAGPNFTAVKAIITSKCGGCHLNGGNDAGYNFDSDCSIVGYWSQINGSCVTYTLVRMPQGSSLTTAQKQSITNWVNAGHGYTN